MRCRPGLIIAAMIVLAAVSCTSVRAQTITAGDLLVELDAATFNTADTVWINSGTLAAFNAVGAPQAQLVDDAMAVVFDGVNDYFDGPLSDAGIEGNGERPTRGTCIDGWRLQSCRGIAWIRFSTGGQAEYGD